jgi:ABC-type phosphate transport system substrate-binding protein
MAMKNFLRGFLILGAASIFAALGHAQVIVIANPNLKADSISKSDLKAVFTGASAKLASGDRVTPVLLKEGATHNTFTTDMLGKSPIALLVSWRGLVMSGQAAMPRSFDSEAEEVAFIARTPGAIGYISQATPHDSVKVLTVQ